MIWNRDGAFFDVTSDDVDFDAVVNDDVISLEVVEEMSKMDSGTVRLLDRQHYYSRILRPGMALKLSWGLRYGNGEQAVRSPIQAIITSPGGGGSDRNEVTYDCSFTSVGFRGNQGVKHYETGTRGDAVSDAITRLGVPIGNRLVKFARMSEPLNAGVKVTQYESTFKFLVRLADEYRAAFRVSYDRAGKPFACFVDYDLIWAVSKATCGIGSLNLSYGGRDANVKSYHWKDNSMDSALGQGARVVMIDGSPVILRTIVENETVKTYRLVPERIKAELATRDLAGRTTLMAEYLSVKDFAQVERFFVLDTTTTAPQGSGIEVNLEMMGDPYVTAGMVATFDAGFPDRIGAGDRTWWVQRATHKMDSKGYNGSLVIKDAYSFSETGVKLAPVGGLS